MSCQDHFTPEISLTLSDLEIATQRIPGLGRGQTVVVWTPRLRQPNERQIMRKIDELLKQNPGSDLFHYTDATGLLGILKEKSIWATSAYHLNDSREFSYAVDLIKARFEERFPREDNPAGTFHGRLRDQLLTLTKDIQVFVASFSEQGDLLSQWLAYSGLGNGYAIGLSAKHFEAAKGDGFMLVRCLYEEAKQIALTDAVIDVLCENSSVGDEERSSRLTKALIAAAAIKHPGFQQEAEWRLVKTSPVGFGMCRSTQFRKGRNGIVPYLRAPLLTEEHARTLVPKSIHIGPNDNVEAAQVAVETLLDSEGLLPFIGKRKVEVVPSKTPYRP
jgi:hypothetical protein